MLTSAQESKEMAFFRGAFVHLNGYRLQKYVKKTKDKSKQTNEHLSTLFILVTEGKKKHINYFLKPAERS